MTVLRLLADDLTGALDSAAAFGSPLAPVPVRWQPTPAWDGSLALDSGTREVGPSQSRDRVRGFTPFLKGEGISIVYKKIDSLLRGNEAEEIDTLLKEVRPKHTVLAPAFPAQGRVTRGGRQFVRNVDAAWQAVPADLVADLEAAGCRVRRASPGDEVPVGTSVWDAETDEDLDRIVEAAAGLDHVLWVGSGGLAAALARRFRRERESHAPALPLPILGLFGTDHPAMRAQLAGVADRHEVIHGPEDVRRLERLLTCRGAVFVSLSIPSGTTRDAAASRIEAVFSALVRRLDPPGTLIVAGGETLRRLCHALGAEQLDVTGEIMPGIPRSILRGGPWDGTVIVSKSGAFGAPDLLRRLIAAESAPSKE